MLSCVRFEELYYDLHMNTQIKTRCNKTNDQNRHSSAETIWRAYDSWWLIELGLHFRKETLGWPRPCFQSKEKSIRPIFALIGTPARPPKPRGIPHGWPSDKPRFPKIRFPVVKKTPFVIKTP
jgi:hypothetical protein